MNRDDAFCELAPYYDKIMDHVDYDRWFTITTELASLLSPPFVHLDAACGTGVLLKRLRAKGWTSVGADLSLAMLRAGRRIGVAFPGAAGDLRALPFAGGIDFATCLFDSINFLLSSEDILRAFQEIRNSLSGRGLFYFDVVTERMITEHFEGQEWTENNGRFSSAWRSGYSRKDRIAETSVRVSTGPRGIVRERIYGRDEIESTLKTAGFEVLGVFDAHTWKPPNKKTVRLDFVAAADASPALRKRFDSVYSEIRKFYG
jgi:SAM-dependent methyltransferase